LGLSNPSIYTYFGFSCAKSPIGALHIGPFARMIGRMNYEQIKRYSLTEIALLALFVLGLFVAQIVVKVRRRVVLSERMPLIGSGLSVSMPISQGWEYEKAWRHESDNSFALVGQLQISQHQGVSVQWRYYLGSSAESAQEILQRRIHQSGSKISSIETVSGTVPMEYGVMFPTSDSSDPFYFGIASLDFGRHLELQVYAHRVGIFDIEDIFLALAKSVEYEVPAQLQAGKDLTETFWKNIEESLLFRDKSDEAFLIKNITGQPIGYGSFRYSEHAAGENTHQQISTQQYEHNKSLLDSTLWLDGDEKRFIWKTSFRRVGVEDSRIYTVSSEMDGTVKISTNFEEDKQFASDTLLMPELFLPECAVLLLNTRQSKAVVDALSPDGMLVPTAIETIDINSALAHSKEMAFAVKVDFLNNPNSFEELYFDTNKKLIGRFEQYGSQQRLWDVTTVKELKQIFGDSFNITNDVFTFVQ